MDVLHRICANIVDIFKIYLKFALITLVIYLVAEWYILNYGAELEAQLEAAAPAEGQTSQAKPISNSTVNKVFRFLVNFFIL